MFTRSRSSFDQIVLVVSCVLVLLSGLYPPQALSADATVRIGGASVFTIPAASGEMTVEGRAAIVQRNLNGALIGAENRSPSSVAVIYQKGVPIVTLGKYRIVTVDATSARVVGTTPASLASRWAGSLRRALADTDNVDTHIAQLTSGVRGGGAGPGTAGSASPVVMQTSPVHQGHLVYIPAGMMIPAKLSNSVSSEVAQPGDVIKASVSEAVNLENGSIPAGSMLIGEVVSSEAGQRMGKSGELTLRLTTLRTPDGVETPITAHIANSAGGYAQVPNGPGTTLKGETTHNKIESSAIRGAIGAGAGALLGTTIGAIAGGGHGAGRGALAGVIIGGGLGVADALLLRKGANVVLPSGQQLQVEFDSPAQLAGCSGNL